MQKPNIPKKFAPRDFEIIHEDLDLIVVNKSCGILSVAALWNRENTVHSWLNTYLQKGNPRSTKCAYVVHRLDQATSGILIFAKSEKVQQDLKNNWSKSVKNYLVLIKGQLAQNSGLIESFLSEDEDYVVHSSQDNSKGKLARTEYRVMKQYDKFSLLKINLLTGKKNQIRVHLAELGHPVLGDEKYGDKKTVYKNLMLHSYSLEITHPFKMERVRFSAPPPEHFLKLSGSLEFN